MRIRCYIAEPVSFSIPTSSGRRAKLLAGKLRPWPTLRERIIFGDALINVAQPRQFAAASVSPRSLPTLIKILTEIGPRPRAKCKSATISKDLHTQRSRAKYPDSAPAGKCKYTHAPRVTSGRSGSCYARDKFGFVAQLQHILPRPIGGFCATQAAKGASVTF